MSLDVGKVLVSRGVITREQLDDAHAQQVKTHRPLGQTLTELGAATLDDIVNALSAEFGLPGTRVNAYTVDPAVVPTLPEKLARRHRAIALFQVETFLTVATADPKDLAALDELRFASGCEIQPVVALDEEIEAALNRYYREAASQLLGAERLIAVEERRDVGKTDKQTEESATALVDQIVTRAAAERASDIHVEPEEKYLRVRFRIDGAMVEIAKLPSKLAPSVAARVKVLGSMDIAERRVPQDGRFTVTVAGRRLDLRVSSYPTVWGEKLVLRLLSRDALRVRLEETGMPAALMAPYREIVSQPEGIVLITGPTGSGKTSTLYATLAELVRLPKNIVTLENPVEYELEGIVQGQTHDEAGFTFATGLRSILRQDPDIILVGEIRDRETADTAIEASLTGHLVLSTLHTNSAVATVTRLVEMGVEPYLVASSLVGVVAQRLVRRLCPNCRQALPVTRELQHLFETPAPAQIYRAGGCKECRQTGYSGRLGVFEMLRMNEQLRQLVLRRAAESELASVNRVSGFRTLREEGIAHVAEGVTTLDEVLSATPEPSR